MAVGMKAVVDRVLAPKGVGALIVARRLKIGWSQREAARALGCSHAHLCRIETGGRKPGLEILTAIAGRYGMDLDTLLVASGRLPRDVEKFILKNPRALQSIRQRMRAA